MFGTTIYNDLKEGGDCKECHGMSHHIIIISGTAGRAFTHIDIP